MVVIGVLPAAIVSFKLITGEPVQLLGFVAAPASLFLVFVVYVDVKFGDGDKRDEQSYTRFY